MRCGASTKAIDSSMIYAENFLKRGGAEYRGEKVVERRKKKNPLIIILA